MVSIPLFFFWGGTHAFVKIYLTELQYLYFGMALAITLFLNLLLSFQVVYVYDFLKKNDYDLIVSLHSAFVKLKTEKRRFFKISTLLFFSSFVPWVQTDWKLIFALTVTHLYLNLPQLKKVFLDL